MLSNVFAPDCVFVPVFHASMGTFEQIVSPLIPNHAVLSYVFAPDCVFVPVFPASMGTLDRA